jgi:hypothetical protein
VVVSGGSEIFYFFSGSRSVRDLNRFASCSGGAAAVSGGVAPAAAPEVCSVCAVAVTVGFRIWRCYGVWFRLFAVVVVVGCWVLEVFVAPAKVLVVVRCSDDGSGGVVCRYGDNCFFWFWRGGIWFAADAK